MRDLSHPLDSRPPLGEPRPLAHLLAHEARTPLNAIKGFAELLLAGAAGPLAAEARGHVAEIARAARDLEAALAEAGAALAAPAGLPGSGQGGGRAAGERASEASDGGPCAGS